MENEKLIPYFACVIKQGDVYVSIPIPYGALENFVRMIVASGDSTVEIKGISMMKI